ncbi:MAG: hypothetical protein AB8B99_17570 [Phormidesmis sp.]
MSDIQLFLPSLIYGELGDRLQLNVPPPGNSQKSPLAQTRSMDGGWGDR